MTIPNVETPQATKTTPPRKGIAVLGHTSDWWNGILVIGLAVGAISALAIVVATTGVIVAQRHETQEADRKFAEYKISVEGKVADAKLEGIKAGKIAGDAVVRQAELEKEAAVARLQTEQIKQVVEWRMVPPENAAKLKELLRVKPGQVNLRFTSGDPESLFLAIQLSRIFISAGWQVAAGSENSNSILFGLHLPDPADDKMKELRSAFLAAKIAFSPQPLPDNGGTSVRFNVSTIAGAPMLYVGSRVPPTFQ